MLFALVEARRLRLLPSVPVDTSLVVTCVQLLDAEASKYTCACCR